MSVYHVVHNLTPPFNNRTTTEQMLIKARRDQIQHKEHFLAVQAQSDREEFERVLRWVAMQSY